MKKLIIIVVIGMLSCASLGAWMGYVFGKYEKQKKCSRTLVAMHYTGDGF